MVFLAWLIANKVLTVAGCNELSSVGILLHFLRLALGSMGMTCRSALLCPLPHTSSGAYVGGEGCMCMSVYAGHIAYSRLTYI